MYKPKIVDCHAIVKAIYADLNFYQLHSSHFLFYLPNKQIK